MTSVGHEGNPEMLRSISPPVLSVLLTGKELAYIAEHKAVAAVLSPFQPPSINQQQFFHLNCALSPFAYLWHPNVQAGKAADSEYEIDTDRPLDRSIEELQANR
ncbi:hypothetical protein FQN53_003290 [Emmonsiellopsis sp. PD_33]|nr:hypothetical protein FQN53_003290 [Emmonsiellopsis sp. PD_33]